MLFVRPVDVKDFLSYKRSPATMMDGFHGSYWNLTDKDEEAESYRMLANIFGMLEKAGFTLDRCRGDHRQYKKGGLLYTVSGKLGQDAQRSEGCGDEHQQVGRR